MAASAEGRAFEAGVLPAAQSGDLPPRYMELRDEPRDRKKLHLSPKTVRNHVSNIFTKLQVADRAQAMTRARDAGLGDL